MKSFDGPMSAKEFNEILEEFRLSVYASAKVLGLSLRQAQRYSAGDPIAAPTARHLRVLRYHINGLKGDRKDFQKRIEALESGRGKIYNNRVDVTKSVLGENRRILKETEDLLRDHPSGLKDLI
jgi:hypothetical protein